jgi:CHRD domain
MRRFLLISLAAAVALGLFATAQAAVRSADKKPDRDHKVTICHRTSSDAKPYVRIKVAKRAALQGHKRHAEDIIPAPDGGCPKTVLSPTEGGTALTAGLTGAVEVPGPGDPDGAGSATIRLRAGQGEICFQLAVQNITLPAAAAHIHEGAAGVSGPVVVTLTAPDAAGMSSGCVNVPRTLVADILANPAGYYVNVHTSDFADGAVRGQLAIA